MTVSAEEQEEWAAVALVFAGGLMLLGCIGSAIVLLRMFE